MMSFSLSGGVEVFGFISPSEPTDTYPVIDPIYGIDGLRNVDTISDLDNIPELRRRAGMVVGVSGGTTYYKLNPSPWTLTFSDWSLFNSGGGSGAGISSYTYLDNTFTILDTSGNTFNATINDVTGLTVNGVISATTYQNLPIDVFVTGGTYSGGSSTFTNNTGGTFNVSGFYTGSTDVFVTGGTYSNGTSTFTNNTGGTFNVLGFLSNATTAVTLSSNVLSVTSSGGTPTTSTINAATGGTYNNGTITLSGTGTLSTITGLYTGATDVFVTGGTYSNGTSTFRNNTGGTFNVNGFYTGATDNNQYVTGFTYSANTFTISDNSGTTFNSTINEVTGLTVNGILSATTISGGTFYGNGLELTRIENLVTVGLNGTNCDFGSIKNAVNSITGASPTNTYVVKVGPGVFYEDQIQMKSYVDVIGESETNTIIEANNPLQTLIVGTDQSMLSDVQVQGCTGTGVSAIVYSSSTTPQLNAIFYVENVRFGSNYTHAKTIGTGGGNCIMQCSNVKYGGYPFTVGFHVTNDGSGIGRMQLRNVTSTNGGVTTTSGLIFALADQPSCAFIVNGCLLTKASGAAAGVGFWVENGGSLRLTGVNFQRWSTGIYAPQVGSAPSIDAIALNFENCTTDVNIVHSGATGKIQGTDNFLKTIINQNSPLYEVNQDPKEITVAKKGGDFTSIKSAVDYLISSGNTSSTNRYVISVGPGEFTENEIDLTQTPYVSIVGSNIQTTLIKPNTNTQNIINIGINNEVSFLTLSGASSGYAGIYCYDIGDFGQAHKLSFYDCDTNIWVESDTQDTKFYGEYIDYNGTYTYGTKIIGNNGYEALANMENYFNFPTGGNITYCNYASGSGATLSVFVGDNQSNGVSGSTAYFAQDGAGLYCSTITIDGFTYGIRNPNVGDPIRFDIDNASIVSGEWDLYVERIGTFGTFGGSSNSQKVYTVSEDVYWAFLDINDGEFEITRKASVTFTDGSHTDFTTLIFEGSSMGLMSGGSLTIVSGFTVQVDGGFGYLEKSNHTGIVRRIDWLDSQITLSADTNDYIFINENSNIGSSGTRPNSFYNIILGRVVTDATGINFIDLTPFHADHTTNRYDDLFSEALGPIYANGSIVTEGTTPFTLDISEGEYYYSTNGILPSGGTGSTFTQYYRNGTGSTWVTTATTLVNNTQYDNNGTLTGLTAGYFTKHTLYTIGDGIYENYFLVLGQNEYSTLVATEDALLPTPPSYFSDSVVQVANIYIQQGTTGITQVEDIRPVIGFKSGGVNASSVHGNLLGLSADDHIQYLLVNGGRPMSGNLDMGTNNITNVGTVDGVTVSAHATRHQFGGLDPVGSTTPGPNYIPYADVSGTLNDWVSTASTTTFGKVKTSSSSTTVVSDNDPRFLNSFTGGTYSGGTLSFTNNSGGTYNISGLYTGSTDVFVTGGTYLNGTSTFTNNTGGTFNVNGFYTGATDVFVTGGTYNNGTSTFTNNTGGTFNVSGFLSNATTAVTLSSNVLSVTSSGGTPTTTTINAATGGTYSNGTITLDGTGTLSTITGLYTGATDVFVTGGTYSNGTSIFTNNTGGTFNVNGFYTGSTDVFVTGSTYSNNTFFYTNNTGGTFNVNFNTLTGLTVNGNLSVTGTTSSGIISATTYQNLPTDVFVTGGTYGNGTTTFTNNTGGTFNVSGFLSNATTAVTLSSNVLSVTSSGGTPTTTTINAATGGTYNNGTITLAGTGTLSTITGLYTGSTDVFVTGGTYSNGTSIFTNNTGGTFNVTGFLSADTYVTGVTYSANTLTVQQNQGQSNITTTIGLVTKSNTITAASFTGTPRKNTVTFTTPYATTSYSIGISGSDNRTFTYESKTVNGFIINTNANAALTGNVDWQTIQIGES